MAAPTTPHYIPTWNIEQNIINTILMPQPIPPPKFADGLSDNILNHVGCSGYSIQMSHDHVSFALDIIENYPFPSSMEEYYKNFRFSEWDIVCETMLVAIRLKRLIPNAWQRFMLGIFLHEHRPICCCVCGLTPGIWCGKSYFFCLLVIITYS